MKRMILPLAAALLLSGPVLAGPIEDANTCTKGVKQPAESYLAYCTRAIQSRRLTRPSLAMVHNNRGAILQMLGREDEAMADFNSAIEFNPGQAFSYLNRGLIFIHRKEFRRAWDDFTRAIQADPDNSMGYVNRSGVYIKTKQYDAALKDLETALALNPRDPFAYHNRALVRKKMNQFDLAYQDSDKAIAYGIEALIKRGMLTPDIYMLRAEYNQNRGRYRKALADLKRALGLKPDYADAHNTRAWILATCPDADVRNGKEAVKAALTALGIEDIAEYRDTLAAAFAETGQFEKAAAEQRYAIKLLRQNKVPADQIASYEKALKIYRQKQPRRITPPMLKSTKG